MSGSPSQAFPSSPSLRLHPSLFPQEKAGPHSGEPQSSPILTDCAVHSAPQFSRAFSGSSNIHDLSGTGVQAPVASAGNSDQQSAHLNLLTALVQPTPPLESGSPESRNTDPPRFLEPPLPSRRMYAPRHLDNTDAAKIVTAMANHDQELQAIKELNIRHATLLDSVHDATTTSITRLADIDEASAQGFANIKHTLASHRQEVTSVKEEVSSVAKGLFSVQDVMHTIIQQHAQEVAIVEHHDHQILAIQRRVNSLESMQQRVNSLESMLGALASFLYFSQPRHSAGEVERQLQLEYAAPIVKGIVERYTAANTPPGSVITHHGLPAELFTHQTDGA